MGMLNSMLKHWRRPTRGGAGGRPTCGGAGVAEGIDDAAEVLVRLKAHREVDAPEVDLSCVGDLGRSPAHAIMTGYCEVIHNAGIL